MANLGDIDGSSSINSADVEMLFDIVRGDRALPEQHSDEFLLSNVGEKEQYQGPGFYEVLKLLKILGSATDFEDGEFEIQDTFVDGKGMQIDAMYDRFVASSPYAKVINYFSGTRSIGFVKVYTKADGEQYSEYDLVLPPLDALNSDGFFDDNLLFGKSSVAIDGDHLAVSAWHNGYSTPLVYLYEKEDGGYVYKYRLQLDSSNPTNCTSSAIVEIYDDQLFVGNHCNDTVKVYSITSLKNADETLIGDSGLSIGDAMTYQANDNFSHGYGKSIVCTDGKNLYIGAPQLVYPYEWPNPGDQEWIASGAVYHYAWLPNGDLHGGGSWRLANVITPTIPADMMHDTPDTGAFYGPNGPPGDYDGDYIDIGTNFGAYIDAENIDAHLKSNGETETSGNASYVAIGAPRWWIESTSTYSSGNHRDGAVFVFQTDWEIADDQVNLETPDASHLKTITSGATDADLTIASGGTRRVHEFGRGTQMDKEFNVYSIYNNGTLLTTGKIFKYDYTFDDQGDWNKSADEVATYNMAEGGSLAMDTLDLVYGNEFDNIPIRVINYPTTSNGIQTLKLDSGALKKKVDSFITRQSADTPCCDDFENKIETYGDGTDRPSVGGVSVQHFQAGGKLCFHDLNIDGLSYPYGVTIDTNDGVVYGKIKATGKFTDNEVVYTAPTGRAYRGRLDSSVAFDNILSFETGCSVDTTPTTEPGTYEITDLVETAGNPDQHGLILLSWEGKSLCEVFEATGKDREFVVPADVTEIFAQVWGAGGSSGRYSNAGGAGGYSEGKFPVTPGETLIIGVGQTSLGKNNNTKRLPGYSPGGSAGDGGNAKWPGGGDTSGAGSGGGLSGVFRQSISAETALLIAGGGGGGATVLLPEKLKIVPVSFAPCCIII